MNPEDAIDLSREAIKTCMMVGGPILIAGLLIGILIGVIQAMTQVQDQTVSFVPKILLLLVAIAVCLPWLTDQMLDFAKYSFEKPMSHRLGNVVTPVSYEESVSSDLVAQQIKVKPVFSTEAAVSNAIPIPNSVQNALPGKVDSPFIPTRYATRTFGQPNSETQRQSEASSGESQNLAPNSNASPANPSPFILPHYRREIPPRQNIGG